MDHTPAQHEHRRAAVEPKPFVWPLLPEAPDDAPAQSTLPEAPPEPPRAPGRLERVRAAIQDAESWWLAPTALPLNRRAAETGWTADDLARYCNRCAQTVGFGEDDEFGCASCRPRRLVWSRAVRLGAYESDLAGWVREVKFHRNASLGVELGTVLAGRLLHAGLRVDRVCVVPIPMSRRERLMSGVDHARCVAEGVAKGLKAPLVSALRRKHGPSQRDMPSATARERNVRRAFRGRPGVDLSGWSVVLVDDVITTGATMRAASRALWPRRSGDRPASLWAAAVAVTPEPGRIANTPPEASR